MSLSRPGSGLLAELAALRLPRPVRILNLCSDQQRVVAMSGMQHLMPPGASLHAGPGCAASLCPEEDLFQALQLVQHHGLTLMVAENLLHVPFRDAQGRQTTLFSARRGGADVRPLTVPMDAFMAARADPRRDIVMFVAGFETLLAPLAGMLLEEMPANLSLLLCGRRIEPLVEQLLQRDDPGFDALLLPGNRCSLTGIRSWQRISSEYCVPAAVAGYSAPAILGALQAILQQCCEGVVRVDNHYRALVREDGNPLAGDRLFRVFEMAEGVWRGIGPVRDSAFRLRHAYARMDADRVFPDYRDGWMQPTRSMIAQCDCAAVMLGMQSPEQCNCFSSLCTLDSPQGPCMASEDGTCHVHSLFRRVA